MILELEKLKVNTKDQVINNQEKVIKCLKVSLDQEKEGALLKNKEQIEGFLNILMSLICSRLGPWIFLTNVLLLVMQYLSWPLTFLVLVVIYICKARDLTTLML